MAFGGSSSCPFDLVFFPFVALGSAAAGLLAEGFFFFCFGAAGLAAGRAAAAMAAARAAAPRAAGQAGAGRVEVAGGEA